MAIRNAKDLRGSKGGNMPFALLAVALLLVSSTFCAIYANLGDSKERTDGIEDELNSLDASVSRTSDFIREGSGKIIYAISADKDAGTLTERTKRFDAAVEEWFSKEFPRCDDGITVTVDQQAFTLDLQSTRTSTGNPVADRSVVS